MSETVTIRWNSGKIELDLAAIKDMDIRKFKQILALEEIDQDGVRTAIRDFYTPALAQYPEYDGMQRSYKAYRDRLIKILALVQPSDDAKMTPVDKALKRLYSKNNTRAIYRGVLDCGGLYTVVHSYSLVRLSRAPSAGLQRLDTTFDAARVVASARDAARMLVNLPSLVELKRLYKAAKTAGKDYRTSATFRAGNVYNLSNGVPVFDCGPGLPCVELENLIDVMSALPGCKVYTAPILRGNLYLVTDDGDGVVLPLRKPDTAPTVPEIACMVDAYTIPAEPVPVVPEQPAEAEPVEAEQPSEVASVEAEQRTEQAEPVEAVELSEAEPTQTEQADAIHVEPVPVEAGGPAEAIPAVVISPVLPVARAKNISRSARSAPVLRRVEVRPALVPCSAVLRPSARARASPCKG